MRTPKRIFAPLLTIALAITPRGVRAQEGPGDATQDKSSGAESSTSGGGGEAEAAKDTSETGEKKTEGEEQSRKISDKIKSVAHKEFLKKSRLEVFPQFAFDLNDPFFDHLIVGAAVGYHFVDSASVELRGGFSFAHLKKNVIRLVRQTDSAVLENPPEFKGHADLDFLWAPLYGKISLLGEGILHFDTYVTAGPGIFATDAGIDPAANFGVGQRYFMNRWLDFRVEIRDYIFMDQRNNESNLQNLMILGFAVSGFVPFDFSYEYE
jgi:outer membrane beta-barrel protein